MDIRETLQLIPEPDPRAIERVWDRYHASRTRPARSLPWMWLAAPALAATAMAGFLFSGGPPNHRMELDSNASTSTHRWSEVIGLEFAGHGIMEGTPDNATITWRSGTVTAEVVPDSDTHLTIVTDEGRVEVVGTVFSVTRDRLGATTSVEHGKVSVSCEDGWSGFVTAESGPHTCLPVRAAGLLGRADALADAGSSAEVLQDTLDRGIALAEPGSSIESELLYRRMHVHGDIHDSAGVIADALDYLEGNGSRTTEVQQYAAWTALAAEGCEVALPLLSQLELTGTPADRVLLAECLLTQQPARAQGLLADALPHLDDEWTDRAVAALKAVRP